MIQFFFKGIYESDRLFQIGLKNAEYLTGSKTLNEILKENNIFRVVSMLMYVPLESVHDTFFKN